MRSSFATSIEGESSGDWVHERPKFGIGGDVGMCTRTDARSFKEAQEQPIRTATKTEFQARGLDTGVGEREKEAWAL